MKQIVPMFSLDKWASKKYLERLSTMELMASASNQCDRNAIAIVALMEVEPFLRYQGMGKLETMYVKNCHQYLRGFERIQCFE
ncbi:MAG: hypothetical protein ACI92E_000979 [Oceanicoccus sp.]|jgi:hypothetical protein